MPEPVTIRTTHLHGIVALDLGLYAWCWQCGRAHPLDVAALAARYGLDRPIVTIKARCSMCGLVDRVHIDWRSNRASEEAARETPAVREKMGSQFMRR